jgi:plastocyanin
VHFALQLAPLAAEKSKVPFYIAGGLLVAWALFISMAIGMRQPSFPANLGQQRAVAAVSAVLVAIAIAMAVVTAGGSRSSSEAAAQPSAAAGTSAREAPSASPPAGEGAPQSTQPTATTGTPAPPSSPAAGATSKLSLAADPGGQLAYDAKTLSAKAGTVTIAFSNKSPIEHNLTIAQGSKTIAASPTFLAGTRTLTVKLKPGSYTFYCSVPGHRQAGMEGTLTVGA